MDYNLLTSINDIPEGWEIKRFEEIAKFSLGRTPPRNNTSYWNEKFFPWVSIKDMSDFGKIYFTKEFVSKKAYKEIFNGKFSPKETLLMSFKLTIGRTSILKIDAFHNEAIISIYPNDNIIDKYFLFYYLPTINFNQYFDKAIKGNTLNKSKIANLKIVIPPLSEQKAIAEVLQTIQEAREKTEAVIEATRQLKKSMMKHLFTYGIQGVLTTESTEKHRENPLSHSVSSVVSNTKLKSTEIGPIPEHWQVVKLGEVVIETVSGDWGNENYFENSILCYVLRGTDFANIEKKQFYKIPKRYIKINSFEKRHLQENDILIELSGGGPDQPTGRIFLVNNSFLNSLDNVCFSNFIKKIRICTDKSDPNFFYRYWQYLYEEGKTKIYEKRTTGIRNFKLNDFIDKESIPLPPLPEQKAIADILQAIDEKIDKEEAKKKALENLFKSMLSELMSGKIRIKV